MNAFALKITVKRIEKMEKYYDTLKSGINASPPKINRKMLKKLLKYYEGGQWLKDYEADEKGLLPSKLKRGVLSEDGVYDLLTEIQAAEHKISKSE